MVAIMDRDEYEERYGEEGGLQERGMPGQPGGNTAINFQDFCTDLNKDICTYVRIYIYICISLFTYKKTYTYTNTYTQI